MGDIKENDLIRDWLLDIDSNEKLQILENNKFELTGYDYPPRVGHYELNQNKLNLKCFPNGSNDEGVITKEFLIDSPHKCKENGSNPYIPNGCDFLFGIINDWTLEFDLKMTDSLWSATNICIGPFNIINHEFTYIINQSGIPDIVATFEKPIDSLCANLTNVKIIKLKNVISIYFNSILEYSVHELRPFRTDLKGIRFDNFSGTIKNIKLRISQPLSIQFDVCEISKPQNSSLQNQKIVTPGARAEPCEIKLVCRQGSLSTDLSREIAINKPFFSLKQLLFEKTIVNDSLKNANLIDANKLPQKPDKEEYFVDVKKNLLPLQGVAGFDQEFGDFYKAIWLFVLFVLGNTIVLYYSIPGGVGGIYGFFAWLYFFCIYWLLVLVGFGLLFFLVVNFFFNIDYFSKSIGKPGKLSDLFEDTYELRLHWRSNALSLILILVSLGYLDSNYSKYNSVPEQGKTSTGPIVPPKPVMAPSQVFQERLNAARVGATKTEEDRNQTFQKLSKMGIEKSQDWTIPKYASALPLAKQLVRLDTESREWDRKIFAYEAAILEANAVERTLEFDKNGIPEAEMKKLEENLRINIEKSIAPNIQGNTTFEFDENFETALKNSKKLDLKK